MNLDFRAVFTGQTTVADLVRDLSHADLITFTNEVLDAMEAQISSDAPAGLFTFVPPDTEASEGTGWTIGHIVAHATATLEGTAMGAAILARGIKLEQRLRYEVPAEELHNLQTIQARLNESRRMCQAFLAAWPDNPDLDATINFIPAIGPMNAFGMYALGLSHAQGHIQQITNAVSAYSQAV